MSVQTVDVNSILTQYPSSNIPSISRKTINFIRTQNFKLSYGLEQIKGKVSKLEQIREQLLNHPHPSRRDKIISVVAALFAISLLVGGILGTYYSAKAHYHMIVGSLPILTWVAITFLGAWYNNKWSLDENDIVALGTRQGTPTCTFVMLPIIGPFIPLYMTFCDTSTYKEAVQQRHAKEIQQWVNHAQDYFAKNKGDARACLERLKENPPQEMPENALEEFEATIRFYTEYK